MKTKISGLLVSTGVLCVAAIGVQAQDDQEMRFAPSELMLCSFKEGQGNGDLKGLTKAFNKWLNKNDTDYTYYLLRPQYHEDSADWDFAWIGSWSDGAGFGAGYDAWLKDDDGVGEQFEELMDCNYSMASVTPISVPENGPWERGVVWFQRCEREDGVGLSDAIGAHRSSAQALAEMAEMGETAASWAFLPALGFGDVDFDYYHVQAWPSHGALGASFDNYFNKGGWKPVAEAEDGKMECQSPNLYTFRLMRAAEN